MWKGCVRAHVGKMSLSSSCRAGSKDWLSGKQPNWRISLERFWKSQERIMFKKLPKLVRACGSSCTFTNKGELIWCVCMHVQSLSCVWLSVTPWTVARQASLSMGFPRQEYWSRLPFPSPGIIWEMKFLKSENGDSFFQEILCQLIFFLFLNVIQA